MKRAIKGDLLLLGLSPSPTCDALRHTEVAPGSAEGRGREGGGGEGGVAQLAVGLRRGEEEGSVGVGVTVRVSASRCIGSAASEVKKGEARGRAVQLAHGGHQGVELTCDEGRGD